MSLPRLIVAALLVTSLAGAARAADPAAEAPRLAELEERVSRLESVAQPLVWLVASGLAGGLAGFMAAYGLTKRAADRTIAAAVGLKMRELHELVEERDLADQVRRRSSLLVVGPDGDRGLERRLRADGWQNASTVEVPVGASEALSAAVKAAKSIDLVVFDRLPEPALAEFCQQLGLRDRRYACFTREPYRGLPNDVRDAVVFGNTPDQALHWIEAAALRQERARRARDPSAPASG